MLDYTVNYAAIAKHTQRIGVRREGTRRRLSRTVFHRPVLRQDPAVHELGIPRPVGIRIKFIVERCRPADETFVGLGIGGHAVLFSESQLFVSIVCRCSKSPIRDLNFVSSRFSSARFLIDTLRGAGSQVRGPRETTQYSGRRIAAKMLDFKRIATSRPTNGKILAFDLALRAWPAAAANLEQADTETPAAGIGRGLRSLAVPRGLIADRCP